MDENQTTNPAPAETAPAPEQTATPNPAAENPASNPAEMPPQNQPATETQPPEEPQGQQLPQADLIGGDEPESKPAEGQQETAEDSVPEHYEQFYDMGETTPSAANKTFNYQLGEIARANGWSQKVAKQNFDQMSDALAAYQTAQIAQWKRETMADPELGGANWQRTQAYANRAFKEFLTDQERAIFRKNGAINQKDIVRLLARIGERITPDPTPAGLQNGNPDSQTKPKTIRDFYARYDNSN